MSEVLNPGVPRSIRKPRMPSSVLAQTTATSAIEPLVIQVFSPFRIHPDPSPTARVLIAAGFDPKSGSVKPKQPIALPDCNRGSQCDFCSSDPYCRIGYMTSAPWTDTKLRSPESPRSISCMMSPYSTLFI